MTININQNNFVESNLHHQYTYIDVPDNSSAVYSNPYDDTAEHTYSAPDEDTKVPIPHIYSQPADNKSFAYKLAYADESKLSATFDVGKDVQGNDTYFLVEAPNEACEHTVDQWVSIQFYCPTSMTIVYFCNKKCAMKPVGVYFILWYYWGNEGYYYFV